MDMVIDTSGGIVVVRLPVRVDSGNAPALEAGLAPVLNGGAVRMVFDFSDLDYMSSMGLRIILTAAKLTRSGQGRLAICGLRPHIREVFEISGFLSVLNVFETQAQAQGFVAG